MLKEVCKHNYTGILPGVGEAKELHRKRRGGGVHRRQKEVSQVEESGGSPGAVVPAAPYEPEC